jgi:hypothetical protein
MADKVAGCSTQRVIMAQSNQVDMASIGHRWRPTRSWSRITHRRIKELSILLTGICPIAAWNWGESGSRDRGRFLARSARFVSDCCWVRKANTGAGPRRLKRDSP